jgi:hypothetical protein
MCAIAMLGAVIYKTDGFKNSRGVGVIDNAAQFEWNYMANSACTARVKAHPGFCMQLGNAEKISIGVLGDSTANSLVPGIAMLVGEHQEGMFNMGHGACPPIRGLIPTATWGAVPNCPDIVEEAYQIVLNDKNIKTVVMSVFGRDMQYWGFKDLPASAGITERFKKASSLLDQDIKDLQSHGKKVVLSYDVPYSPTASKDCINRPYSKHFAKTKNCDVTEDKIIERFPYLTLYEEHFKNRKDICVLHQSDVLFTNGRLNFTDKTGRLLIRDTHHLSEYGSQTMARMLEKSDCNAFLPWIAKE